MNERRVEITYRSSTKATTTSANVDNPFEIEWTDEIASVRFYLNGVEVGTVYAGGE